MIYNLWNALLRLGLRLLRLYWRLFRPTTLGSRCMVLSEGSVLLVRHTYDDEWHFPGGGVHKGESFAQAARREVREESGLHVRDLRLFHVYHNNAEGKNDHVALFVATEFAGTVQPDSREIARAEFFPLDGLPDNASCATRRRVAEYLGGQPHDDW